ncbi:MAG: hypothetical protein AAF483_23380 [Planctomycetota bacterium]
MNGNAMELFRRLLRNESLLRDFERSQFAESPDDLNFLYATDIIWGGDDCPSVNDARQQAWEDSTVLPGSEEHVAILNEIAQSVSATEFARFLFPGVAFGNEIYAEERQQRAERNNRQKLSVSTNDRHLDRIEIIENARTLATTRAS